MGQGPMSGRGLGRRGGGRGPGLGRRAGRRWGGTAPHDDVAGLKNSVKELEEKLADNQMLEMKYGR